MNPLNTKPLPGGSAVWLFMSVEVVTFGLFLLGFAASWSSDPAGFAAAQARLHVGSGARGTAILLVGSWFAFQGVLANGRGRPGATAAWLGGAGVAGLVFSANKLVEYASPELAGVGLSTHAFWFFYLFLTVVHLVHVLGGVGALALIGWRARRGDYGPDNALTVEAVAAYYHFVDVIWVLLFPILYVMHP